MPGDAPPLIAPDRSTVATLLKQHGYATAAIGKWHLGMTLGSNVYVDRLTDGPLDHGFDQYFGISASADLPSFAYIENDHFTEVPAVMKDWGTAKWGLSGLATKGFDWADVLPNLARRAIGYVEQQAATKQPFFLYLALNPPPILRSCPPKSFKGKSVWGTTATS